MPKQVMEDESAIPVIEDEAIQFECLLVEPQDDHISVDAFLCFHRNSSGKCMEMEDIPCKFGGDNFGTDPKQKHILGQEVLDINCSEIEAEDFLAPNGPSIVCEDYLLDADFGEIGKKLDHDSGIGLQKLVSGSHNQADNAGESGTSHKSDSSDPTFLNKCLGDVDMNDSSSHDIFSCTAVSEMSLEERWFKYPTFTVENMEEDVSSLFLESNEKTMSVTYDVASGEVLSHLSAIQESKHTPVGQNKDEESLLGEDASPSKSPIQANTVSHAEKRLRKPPRRFIDELSEPKSKPQKRREVSTLSSKRKFPRVGSMHYDIKSKAEKVSFEDSAGKAIQVPFGPIVNTESRISSDLSLVQEESRKSRASVVAKVLLLDKKPLLQPNKQALIQHHKEAVLQPQKEPVSRTHKGAVLKPQKELVSQTHKVAVLQPQKELVSENHKGAVLLPAYEEASLEDSEEDDVAEVKIGEDGGRRKHHILWTVSEVKKLIDGVSKYGVGRWSRIKKDLFPSSAHRTPVDLKDKWRNLLKASCAQRESKKGEDKKRNLAWRPLPKTILQRVSELATIHPYPRDLRSKR